MSTLSTVDRRCLENLFVMSSGAVLDFSNRNFKVFVFEAVTIDIYDDRYAVEGPSKARTSAALLPHALLKLDRV